MLRLVRSTNREYLNDGELPGAVATGKLTSRPFSIVIKIIYDKDTKKAKGVKILDAETNKTYEFFSKIIFVCALSSKAFLESACAFGFAF